MRSPPPSPPSPSPRTVSSSTASTAPSYPKTTVTSALTARHLDNPPSAYRAYLPYIAITDRFMGSPPSFYNILSLSPPAVRTQTGLFARFFHAPAVDLRLPNTLSPEHRRLTFLAASDAFSCDFCTASAFSLGDMLRGSLPSQALRGHASRARTPLHPTDARLSPSQRAVVAYARAAVVRPLQRGVALLGSEVGRLLGGRALEMVKAVIAFSGFSNSLMDVLGVATGAAALNFAREHVVVCESEHHATDSETSDVGEEDGVAVRGQRGENFKSLLAALQSACKSAKGEMYAYERIPHRTAKLDGWMNERLGEENCAWFRAIQGTELKRAFCFGLRENVVVDDDEKRCWSPASRSCFLYLFGRVTECVALAEMAIELMPGTGCGLGDEPRRELSRFVRCGNGELVPEMAVGRRLVFASAVRMSNISSELVEDLVETCTPEAIIELASLISFFELWRRMVLLFTRRAGCARMSRLSQEAPLTKASEKGEGRRRWAERRFMYGGRVEAGVRLEE